MLNLGMTEVFCFAIIALLVLGPDKLPEAARFAARWYGKIKKFINNVQHEIDQELRLSEFKAEMQKEIDKMTEFELRIQKQLDEIKTAQVKSQALEVDQTTALSLQAPTKYIPFSAHPKIPFSIQYQTLLANGQESSQAFVKSSSGLKIAV